MGKSREIWDEARKANSSVAFIKAILYELQPIRLSAIDTATLPSLIFKTLSSLFTRLLECSKVLVSASFIKIICALIAIFTIGLNDTDVTEMSDRVSAYSVFNRRFQSMMGSIDADNLLAQHVGGAGATLALQRQHENNDVAVAEIDRDTGGEGIIEEEPINGNDNENIQHPLNESRKSGKKARRKNLETRREIQRQRNAAAAMGFGGGANGIELAEQFAVQTLIEEQVAAAELEGDEVHNVLERD